MPPVVLLHDAVALAGRYPVLAGVDLRVDAGEVVVVAGPNGAGKTSLLRACAGLLALSGGTATVLGHDLRTDRSSVRRQVGLFGHAPAVYDELTVRENVRFAVRAGGAAVSGVDAALERLGLSGRLARTPAGRLSAGQRRRVQLAVLAARRLPLWLLDEPHAGLDAGARAVLGELVREIASEGTAVLLASHELAVSLPVADRVVEMAGGRVVAEAPVASARTPEDAVSATPPAPGDGLPAVPAAPVSRGSSSARGGVHVA